MDRLAESTLGSLAIATPAYDRRGTSRSIVHLGLGNFARAHLCVYLDQLLELGHHDLALLGVSLRHDEVPRALRPQDGLYVLGLIDGAVVDHRVIGSVTDLVHAPSEPERVRDELASASVSVVSVTVTEKGYCSEPSSRRLDRSHPDVRHDLAHPERPRSLPGHLVLMAADRRAAGTGPITVLSLDNIPSNGQTLSRVVRDLAAEGDRSLVDWIDANVAFPCSMVDRMVPATDDGYRASVAAHVGVEDAWPVRAEPFSQWVVERTWATAMAPLDLVGVQVVDDVGPWERLKLRVLNALHTTAAHYGLANGLETIDAVVVDPGGRAFVDRVAAEIEEVIVPPPGLRTSEYLATTLARFANSGLAHRCAQVAVDTSQKLPQRLLVTLSERLDRGLRSPAIAEVLALWAWSTLGRDHEGAPRAVDDPLAPEYAAIAARHGDDPAALAGALLSIEAIFGPLTGHVGLTGEVGTLLAARLG
jgi:fructuronate reductase